MNPFKTGSPMAGRVKMTTSHWSESPDLKNVLNSHFSKHLHLKQDNAGESIVISSLSSDQLPEVNKLPGRKPAFLMLQS